MPFRRLPDTNPTRLNALEGLRKKHAASSSGVILITQAQAAQVDLQSPISLYSRFKKEVGHVAPALATQVAATTLVDTRKHRLHLLVTQAILNILAAIEREDLAPEVRGLYQLGPNQETLPELVTKAQLLAWAGHLQTGETARLASPLPKHAEPGPLAWPSLAQINTAVGQLEAAEADQLRAKEKTDLEQEEVSALVAEVDTFIKDAWDTIEFNLRTHDGPSLRRRAREWGVFYATRPGEAEETEPPVTPPTPTPPPTP